MSYDNEGRLAAWQNAPSSPTSSDSFLYDGEGNRVEQQATTNGSIITSTGASTTLTKYMGAQGLPTAERVGTNGPLAYLATDGQGTVSESLDGSGNVTSAQLYTPYGTVRYSSGSSPTSLGYTGQRADSATGLDYYHARYYDPAAGQFTSADTVQDGLNRYGYVAGNPTTATDPSGHRVFIQGMSGAEQEQINKWMIKAARMSPASPSTTSSDGGDGLDYCNSKCYKAPRKPATCDAQCIADYQKRESDTQQRLNALDSAKNAAQSSASNDVDYYNGLLIMLAAFGAAATLASAAVAENPFLAGAMLGLGVVFGLLAVEAAQIKAVFDEEKHWSKEMFTQENVRGLETRIYAIGQTFAWINLGLGFFSMLLGLPQKNPDNLAKLFTSGVTIWGGGIPALLLADHAIDDLKKQASTLHL